jgi:hypothetical protein
MTRQLRPGWMERFRRWYTVTAILVLNVVVLVAALESGSVVLWDIRTHLTIAGEAAAPEDVRELSPYYATRSWSQQYWKEFGLTRKEHYRAFTLWRRAPFKGTTINIDDRGVRMTPGADCRPGAYKVFTFGSSHMWGTGAPDWETIAAHLQSLLANAGRGPVCVTNFGESAWVSMQSVIELMMQLQSGNIPDLVISFDGAADIYTAYQSGVPGIHENFEMTAARMEGTDTARLPLLVRWLQTFSTYQLIEKQVERLSSGDQSGGRTLRTYESMHLDRDTLARAVEDAYLANYRAVDALAAEYGFDYYFFWPPHLTKGHKRLTPEEVALGKAVDPALRRLHDSVYSLIDRRIGSHDATYRHLVTMSDVFDSVNGLVWLDDSHTTPEGNALIADRMFETLRIHR